MNYASLLAPAPQSEPLNERQVQNHAGGYVFAVDDWTRLDRFLVLGNDGGTYYQTPRKMTREAAACVTHCYDADPVRTVQRIIELSDSGRIPRNDTAIFALALGAAHGEAGVRRMALDALPAVCRTATHLFQFVAAVRLLGRGWGRSLKRAVAQWYDAKPVDAVAYQAIKYRSREGYTHKRMLQSAHPRGPGRLVYPQDPNIEDAVRRTALYRWICGKDVEFPDNLPPLVHAHLDAMATQNRAVWRNLIAQHKLPWEALPTEANADPGIWQAMLPHLGLTAMIRNLGNMSRLGAIPPLSDAEALIVRRLGDVEAMRKARIHPFALLLAHSTYGAGQGVKGSGTWTPSRPVLDALDDAFYRAFATVEPTGKRFMLALDVSGSMGSSMIQGTHLSAREASAAMALVAMATEPLTYAVGFTGAGHHLMYGRLSSVSANGCLTPLAISPKQRLGDVVSTISGLPFGSTDCALPMLYAMQQNLSVDAFVVFTDSETWAGAVHPVEALRQYRARTGINAKLVVVAMTSTGFSIADPNDPGMLDVVGFDSNAPAIIADFVRG